MGVDAPPDLGPLTVSELVAAERVIASVSGEYAESLDGIFELQRTVGRLAQRLDRLTLDIAAILTRWTPQRISGRAIEGALAHENLGSVVRIPPRSALVARAGGQACLSRPGLDTPG